MEKFALFLLTMVLVDKICCEEQDTCVDLPADKNSPGIKNGDLVAQGSGNPTAEQRIASLELMIQQLSRKLNNYYLRTETMVNTIESQQHEIRKQTTQLKRIKKKINGQDSRIIRQGEQLQALDINIHKEFFQHYRSSSNMLRENDEKIGHKKPTMDTFLKSKGDILLSNISRSRNSLRTPPTTIDNVQQIHAKSQSNSATRNQKISPKIHSNTTLQNKIMQILPKTQSNINTVNNTRQIPSKNQSNITTVNDIQQKPSKNQSNTGTKTADDFQQKSSKNQSNTTTVNQIQKTPLENKLNTTTVNHIQQKPSENQSNTAAVNVVQQKPSGNQSNITTVNDTQQKPPGNQSNITTVNDTQQKPIHNQSNSISHHQHKRVPNNYDSQIKDLNATTEKNAQEIQGLVHIMKDFMKVHSDLNNKIQKLARSYQVYSSVVNQTNSTCQKKWEDLSTIINQVTVLQKLNTQFIQKLSLNLTSQAKNYQQNKMDITRFETAMKNQSKEMGEIKSGMTSQAMTLQSIKNNSTEIQLLKQSMQSMKLDLTNHIQSSSAIISQLTMLSNKNSATENRNVQNIQNLESKLTFQLSNFKQHEVLLNQSKLQIANLTKEIQLLNSKIERLELQKSIATGNKQQIQLLQTRVDIQELRSSKQVAFVSELTREIVNPPNSQTIVFDHVFINSGNGYSEGRGLFVTPFSGFYHFTVEITFATQYKNDHTLHVRIVKNGQRVSTAVGDHNDVQWIKSAASVILRLSKGDQVWCITDSVKGGNTIWGKRGGTYSTFSGFLIYVS